MDEDYQKRIRNFCIVAHIDHGKSTLADRLLELTGTIPKEKMREQFLDRMELERERGITIKMQPVRMAWNEDGKEYVLNLIDTPGHVDFGYEVSRALAAVEGAVLLVDATKGVQAQTLSNLHLARSQGLVIIPVINKIDMTNARPEEVKEEIAHLLEISPEEVLEVSAKEGRGVEKLIRRVRERIPPPRPHTSGSRARGVMLRALVFDSVFDPYKGIIAHIRVFEGTLKKNNPLILVNQGIQAEALEVGVFIPDFSPRMELQEGEIGYVATGIKEAEKIRVGETITVGNIKERGGIEPLSGYREPKPMVFVSFFTEQGEDYELLRDALRKLKLQDASLSFEDEYSPALGRGYRCGFLGLLHLDIISERLKREFGLKLVITSPTVLYGIKIEGSDNEITIRSPQELPEQRKYTTREPWAKMEILVPAEYLGKVQELLNDIRGEFGEVGYLGKDKLVVTHYAPLSEIISGFFDRLKGVSSGYASLNYEVLPEFRDAPLGKLEILLAGEKIEAFSMIAHESRAYREGKRLVERLKEVLPPQHFVVTIQATFGGRIIVREDKKALRKDVIAGLYGGDYSRKRKLLEKQKKGKKKMKAMGKVNIPSEVFLEVLKR